MKEPQVLTPPGVPMVLILPGECGPQPVVDTGASCSG